MPSAVVPVLGLKIGGTVISAKSVARAIGGEKLLLVLDNCEHLADAAAQLAEALVRMCPNASVLATSRELLRIEGEYVYRVPPLDVPPQRDDAVNADEYSSVQLFTIRLTALDSGFSATRREPAADCFDLPAARRHPACHRICGSARRDTGTSAESPTA